MSSGSNVSNITIPRRNPTKNAERMRKRRLSKVTKAQQRILARLNHPESRIVHYSKDYTEGRFSGSWIGALKFHSKILEGLLNRKLVYLDYEENGIHYYKKNLSHKYFS